MSDQSLQKSLPVSVQRRQAADDVHQRVCRAFGSVLKAARTRSGLSQQKLAEGAGADRSYLSMLERGLQQPTLAMLLRIASALRAQPEQLVTETMALLHTEEA